MVVVVMTISSVAQSQAYSEVSRWVAPDVSEGHVARELVSEQSIADRREEARVAGYAAGILEGRQEGQAQAKARLELLEKLIAHVTAPLKQLEPETLAAMIELSLKVSRALINRELSLDSALVLKAVAKALDAAPAVDTPVRILVNPRDLAVVQGAYLESELLLNPVIVGDPAVTVGGAVVESGMSVIDAQLDTRLADVLAELLDPMESE